MNEPTVDGPAPERPESTRGAFVRAIHTPEVAPRVRWYDPPEPLRSVEVAPPGFVPASAVVGASEVTSELIERLTQQLQPLPRLECGEERGAVDVQLEGQDGGQVKTGTVILEGDAGRFVISPDPVTRRFRLGGLRPGAYALRAAAVDAGAARTRVTVRENDITRAAVKLDGAAFEGTATARFVVRGTNAERIRIRAREVGTGRALFERLVDVRNGRVEIEGVRFGKIHWEIDDGIAKSCYESEENPLTAFRPYLEVELIKIRDLEPDPPPPEFLGLPNEFAGVARALPALGIRSLAELAAAEPEDLMHRMQRAHGSGTPVFHNQMLATAVDAARASLGMVRAAGPQRVQLRLRPEEECRRAYVPRTGGEVVFDIELGEGNRGEVMLELPSGEIETHAIESSKRLCSTVSADSVHAGRAFKLALKNTSNGAFTAIISGKLPENAWIPGFGHVVPSTKEQIEAILQALAVRNPGLHTSMPSAVMAPENIQMWLDRARTLMNAAGVCSINDLGRFRANPMPILRSGAYIAPAVQPAKYSHAKPLSHYKFSGVLSNSVLVYRPNDIKAIHETALVLADEWDIRGKTVVIGNDVQELLVVVKSILSDKGSSITWEGANLPAANTYFPATAPNGAPPANCSENGHDGIAGDSDPDPFINGGARAAQAGPTISLYILDGKNLPPINLRGQQGGAGGKGQNGGNGGKGAEGCNADGTFFGGCCRGVGWGGNGGRGGDGGLGGKGGRGGRGGRITLLTTAETINAWAGARPDIDVSGGRGGDGGPGGSPGKGGTGGPAGSADCEPWCAEHPERRGTNGADGVEGPKGFDGDPGPKALEDAIQILPITKQDWETQLNQPHILDLMPHQAEPGETVKVFGENFDPTRDRVFFDGKDLGPVLSSGNLASFQVPWDTDGGNHPVVIRPASTLASPIGVIARRSNKAILHVVPKLAGLAAGVRWVENEKVSIEGFAFKPGLQVRAEDWSVSPHVTFSLPVVSVTRTKIEVQIPGPPLAELRGVRRIVVRNPDGGESRGEHVARISDTIVVRCAAFRVRGKSPGIGTSRSEAAIASFFGENSSHSASLPWGPARIVFQLVQPVKTIQIDDDLANQWPHNLKDTALERADDLKHFNTQGGIAGALNFFFFRDITNTTAYAWVGQGLIMMGDEGNQSLGTVDFQEVIAHEAGHAMCLRHYCAKEEEDVATTLLGQKCQAGDKGNLMYPHWNVSNNMTLVQAQIDAARDAATHTETGKTSLSFPFAINRCGGLDLQS